MIAQRNSRLYVITQFLHSLVFTIPIWIVFYQGKLTVSEISFIVGFGYFIQVVGELPTGALADILGKKPVIILGFILSSIGYVLFPFAQNFGHFLLLTSLVGLSDSLLSGSVEAITYDSLKQEHKEKQFPKLVGTQAFWYQIGLVFGTLSGGLLYSIHHVLPYLLYGISLVLAGILSFMLIEPKIDTVKFTVMNYMKQMKYGALEAFRNADTTRMSLFYILVGSITWSCALYFNSYMMVSFGFSDQVRGVLEGSLRLFNILILTKLLENEHIFTGRISILFFPIVMIFSLLPGIFLGGFFGLPFVAGAMMASTARWIVLAKYTNLAFSSKYRATALSTLSMFVGVLYIIITWGSAPIIAHLGIKWMYTLLGIVTICTVLPLGLAVRKRME